MHIRSSVEVEESLEVFPDPRDFYSLDSPELGDNFDSNQVSSGSQVQDDNQADSGFAPNVRFSYLGHASPRLINAFQQPQVLPHPHLPQPAPPICCCTCARTWGADQGQEGRHTHATSSPEQIVTNTQGHGSRGSGCQHGGKQQHREVEQNLLAVSSGPVQVIPLLTVS